MKAALFIVTASILLAAAILEDAPLGALAVMALITGLACIHFRQVSSVISWTFAVPAFYLLYFCIIPLIQRVSGDDLPLSTRDVDSALLLAAAGIVCFSLGAATVHSARRDKSAEAGFARGPFLLFDTFPVIVFLLALGLAATTYSFLFGNFGLTASLESGGELSGPIGSLGICADIALVFTWAKALRSRSLRWFALGAMGTSALYVFAFFAKSKGALIFPLLHFATAHLVVRGSLSRSTLTVAAVVFSLFAYPFVTKWRERGTTEYSNRWEQVQEGVDVLTSGDWMKSEDNLSSSSSSLSRGLLPAFSTIVSLTGSATPFENGSTYVHAAGVFVPRMFWPDKPPMKVGNIVGRKYDFISNLDEKTNISPSIMGEMYMNFGAPGVLLGMFVWGLVAAFVDGFAARHFGMWFRAWSLPVAFFGQEAPLAHLIAPFIKSFSLVLGLCIILHALVKLAFIARSPRSLSRNSNYTAPSHDVAMPRIGVRR